MRDRLIELLNKKYDHFCDQCGINKDSHYTDSLADYLLANGVIVPPCKVGDILYAPMQCGGRIVIVEYVVIAIQSSIRDEWIVRYKKIGSTIRRQCFICDIGKTIFRTKEEAKQALKGGAE